MAQKASEATQDVQLANDYEFPAPQGEIPARPDRLFIPEQLRQAVAEHAPDDVTIEINERFTRTVVRAQREQRGDALTLELSWDAFQDEEHYGGDGWVATISGVNHALKHAPEP